MMADIEIEQINAVLLKVAEIAPNNGDTQLSILAHALAVGCHSCNISKHTAMICFAASFDYVAKNCTLTPLDTAKH
jgi:hypothetical protein